MGCNSSSEASEMASVSTKPRDHGEVSLDVVTLQRGNDSVEVYLWGATLTSWKSGGEEMIFMSTDCLFNGKKALRGGVPVVFPCFGAWDLGPQHGFARTSTWTLGDSGTTSDGDVFATFILNDSDTTRAMWDFAFELKYTVTLREDALTMNFSVDNKSSAAFDFTALLHTYLRVANIRDTTVSGLQGLTYIDKVNDGAKTAEKAELVDITGFTDRVYIGALNEHRVTNVASSRERTKADHSSVVTKRDIVISKANFPDTVVWNPWIEKSKTMGDLGDDNFNNFLCVEAGAVASPVELGPGANWQASQTLTIHPVV